jgi:hypothetical protein
VWKIDSNTNTNTNTSIIIYTCIYTKQFPKVALLEKTKEGRKEERMRVNNNEIHHISDRTRHNETH